MKTEKSSKNEIGQTYTVLINVSKEGKESDTEGNNKKTQLVSLQSAKVHKKEKRTPFKVNRLK